MKIDKTIINTLINFADLIRIDGVLCDKPNFDDVKKACKVQLSNTVTGNVVLIEHEKNCVGLAVCDTASSLNRYATFLIDLGLGSFTKDKNGVMCERIDKLTKKEFNNKLKQEGIAYITV